MESPKVFIGIITAEAKQYAEDLFMLHLNQITYPNKEIVIVDNSEDVNYCVYLCKYGHRVIRETRFKDLRKTLIHSRNRLRKEFLESDCDYFFSLESDVLCIPDAIDQLMMRRKEIVSGIYCYPSGAPIAFDYAFFSNEMRQRVRTDVCRADELLSIKIIGLGLALIKREVIEKIKFRYVDSASGTDDVWFSLDALAHGYKVYLDTAVKCDHYGNYGGFKEVIQFDKV